MRRSVSRKSRETTHIIEVDESQRRLIIGTLNEKRNAMVEQGRDTGQLDEAMLAVIDAPAKRQRRREARDSR